MRIIVITHQRAIEYEIKDNAATVTLTPEIDEHPAVLDIHAEVISVVDYRRAQ